MISMFGRSARNTAAAWRQSCNKAAPRRYASTARPHRAQCVSPWAAWGLAVVAVSATYLATASPVSMDAPALVSQRKLPNIDAEEVQKHVSRDSAWVVIDGVVLDVTTFLDSHPGGAEWILDNLGKDISPIFNRLHASDVLQKTLPKLQVVGMLSSTAKLEVVKADEDGDEVDQRREELPDPSYVINLNEFEALAKTVLGEDSRAWKFFSSYADDGASFSSTRDSFSFLRFLPRLNRPVDPTDTSTTYLGATQPIPIPIIISPTGATANGHPDGELNMTRASAITGIPQIVSTMSSISMTDIGAERDRLVDQGGKRTPLWWQLYIMKDRKESERRIRQAVEAGAEAIVITVDIAAIGKREADAPRGQLSSGVAASTSHLFDANMTWADIAWVKKHAAGLPVLVKGLGSAEDVALAKQHGARGVFLSNHGARQLDHSPPPIATLVRLRREHPELLSDPDFDVFIDGGIRRGTDVLKALCLGAKGVGLGRPFLYAQACYGHHGVVRATRILEAEIASGMKLLGAKSVQDLKPEMLELLPGLVGEQLK